jgi:methylated-DNA-[protein]-cysteine S-methyltransferase
MCAACGRNPVPLLIPCHRVVRSDGARGGYGAGGGGVRAALLVLERGDLQAALLTAERGGPLC